MSRFFPWLFPLLAAAWILPAWKTPSVPADQPQIYAFARIPVVQNGRVKPLDTIARTHLRIISNRETMTDEKKGSLPAIEWLLHLQAARFGDREERTRHDRVFRLDHPQLRDLLGLPAREGFRYSIEEFAEKLPQLGEPLGSAHDRKTKNLPLDAFEKQMLEFEQHIGYYERLASFKEPHLVAPAEGKDWRALNDILSTAQKSGVPDPEFEFWKSLFSAYATNNAEKFNSAVYSHLEKMEASHPADVRKAAFELRFNNLDLFSKCKWLYALCFLLGALGWLGYAAPMNRAAWLLGFFTFWVHTFALIARIYLSGRPPVTNLYSSAIFIGWGAVILGLGLERIYKLGIGNIIASVAGFVTLVIAHILAADGDTMEVLQAVLDTQFWLATHVTSITFGYATTYVTGLLGLIFIVRGVFTKSLTPEIATSLSRMMYGTVCFATFFSFVGTVLGGLWADDSWGRFWGWDPKENGALLIVLWNALLLHARWGGLVRERGIAVMAVLGNIVVSWSWFGVNQLGKGLHSYGFTDGIALTLWIFAGSQLAIAGFGMLPKDLWRSPLTAKGAAAGKEEHA